MSTPEQRAASALASARYRERNRDQVRAKDRAVKAAKYAALSPEERTAKAARELPLIKAWRARNPALANQYTRAWQLRNAEVYAAARKARYDNDPEYRAKNNATSLAWREANRPRHRALVRGWAAKHPAACRAHEAQRKTAKMRAVPSWADLDTIKDVYAEAQYFQLHVDHIVPLQSKRVCGLHVWDNLQLLTPQENSAKGNRSWPDM